MRELAEAVLVEEPPEIEFRGKLVFFTDPAGRRRAMVREVAVRFFADFAEKLRQERLSGAEVVQIFPPELHAASSA